VRITLARLAIVLLAATLLALSGWFAWQGRPAPKAADEARAAEPLVIPSKAGAVAFNHVAHAALPDTPCDRCHHTSSGARVDQGCRGCHRVKGARIASAQEAFHGQCLGCHTRRWQDGGTNGPVSRCSGCHAPG
jgi:hypothetical protein